MIKKNVLYFYEKRIPNNIRKLIISEIKKKNFSLKQVNYNSSEKEIKKSLSWANAVFFAPGRYLKKNIIQSAKHVKIFQLWSSGYEKFNLKDSRAFGIPVCNNGSENSTAVAEHAVLMILALNKKLIHFYKRTVDGNWKNNSHGFDLYELKNKKVGLLGLGKIGREVAKILKGFECQVFYFDIKRLSKKEEKKLSIIYKTKNQILRNADILSLHLHLNNQTKNYINKKNIKMLKKESLIINVSRAELIERNSLIKALKNKSIRGFGIDTHYTEPTIKNDSLLKLENVLSTPHIAGSTIDTYKRVISKCLDNIKKALLGKKIKYIVS
jgi:lactate dehydrogenase-like 2-hydroxyacid dehydrogenase